MSRLAHIERKTGETNVQVDLNVDGRGEHDISTGVGFFDHMLTLLAVHGLFDLRVKCQGDIEVDAHHTVEDVGIALGAAFLQALGDRKGIQRIGFSYVPLDEALARTVVDFSGRGYLALDADLDQVQAGEFAGELVEDFLYAFVANAKATLHATLLSGRNGHHKIEVIFKSLARALRRAVELDPRQPEVPSSKGVLV